MKRRNRPQSVQVSNQVNKNLTQEMKIELRNILFYQDLKSVLPFDLN